MARDDGTGTSRREFVLAGAAARANPPAGRDVTDADLDLLQRQTFEYFVREADPATGLTRDHIKVVARVP